MVAFDYLNISGKDIEIALTEIGELQNHINSLVKDEDEKKTLIENLRKKRDQLQRQIIYLISLNTSKYSAEP